MDLFAKMYNTVLQIVTNHRTLAKCHRDSHPKKHSRKPQKQQLSIQIQLNDKMNKIKYGTLSTWPQWRKLRMRVSLPFLNKLKFQLQFNGSYQENHLIERL